MATEDDTNNEDWLAPKDHISKSHQYRRRSINERAVEQVMRDWYGERIGAFEIEKRQSKEKEMNEVVDDLLLSWKREDKIHLRHIIDRWDKIIGAEFARSTRPRNLYEGVLTIEVFNPTVRYKLNLVKRVVQQQIMDNADVEIKEVRFITGGQSSARPDKR